MSNFKAVFKVLFTKSYSSNLGKKKKISILTTLLIFGFLGIFLSIVYNFLFYFSFSYAGIVDTYPLLFSVVVFVLTLITSIFRSQIILFSNKDHAILNPMPIKKNVVISAKLLLFYLEELVFSLILLVPTIVLYSITDIWFLLLGTGLMLIIPLIAILFSSVIGFLFSFLSNRYKITKIIFTMLYVALFVGFMMLSFSFSSNAESDEMFLSIGESLRKIFLFDWIYNGFIQHQILYILLVLGLSLISALLVILVYAKCYSKLYGLLMISESKKKYNKKDINKSSTIRTIMLKDAKMLFGNPLFLLNTCSGSIVSVVMITIFLINYDPANMEAEEKVVEMIKYGLPLMICLFTSMSSITTFGISIENKNIWMIKTFPIKFKDLAFSKLLLNQLINGSLALICSIIVCIICQREVGLIIFTILYPQAFIFVFALFGLLLNMLFPKIPWDNFNQIKNSPAVLIYTFGMLFLSSIIVGVSLVSFFLFNQIVFYIFCIGILCIFGVVLSILLIKLNKKIMSKIEL